MPATSGRVIFGRGADVVNRLWDDVVGPEVKAQKFEAPNEDALIASEKASSE